MALRSLIPPKIASAASLGKQASAQRMVRVVDFYSKLPKGAPAKKSSLNPFARYKARYIDGENASGAPIVHVIAAMLLIGYTIDYQTHLKHHKNNHH